MKFLFGGALFFCASIVSAQAIKPEPPMRHFLTGETEAIKAPDLAFKETAVEIDDYDKYFFFHRDATSFDEAYADIKECDALASGFSFHAGGAAVHYPYAGTLGGAIGGAIGNAMADAIFGSAQRRAMRRTNLRNCMGFKEYHRYGLKKDLWVDFNFEEGNGRKDDDVREAAILKQAKLASGPKPDLKVLEK